MRRDIKISVDIESVIRAVDDGARQGLELGSALVVESARQTAPQHTGTLVNSIQALPPEGTLTDGAVTATVSAGAPYAGYVEFGTGVYGPEGSPIWVEPTKRKALRFPAPGGDGFWFSKGHFVQGSKSQPFLIPAMENNVDAIAEIISDAIEVAIDEAGD